MKKDSKTYDNDWPIVAICYDFDKTLSPKDMQNFDLIPKLKCSIKEFWKNSNEYAKKEGMDTILSYMKLIIHIADSKSIKLTEKDFNELGEGIVLFPGVDTWFERINDIAREHKVNIEHYVISAGLKEIIQGTVIADYFTEIFASSFAYDVYNHPIWPRQIVNYTSKTQYLFRISKNCLDLSDEKGVNEYISDCDRKIPFRNFIYIGDSDTDIPAMKVINNNGGVSIGVYNKDTVNIDRVKELLLQNRINFLMPADYSKDSKIEALVEDILKKINVNDSLSKLNRKQSECIENINDFEGFIQYTKDFVKNINNEELLNIRKQAKKIIKKFKKSLINDNMNVFTEDEINTYFSIKEKEVFDMIDGKISKIKKK